MRRLIALAALLGCAALLVMAQDNTSSVTTVGVHGWDNAAWDRIRGSENTGLAATSPLAVVSETQSQAFTTVYQGSSNPNALAISATSGSKRLFFDKAIFSTSSAVSIQFVSLTSAPTTCGSASQGANLVLGGAVSTASVHYCSGVFGGLSIGSYLAVVNLPANGSFELDLRGIIAAAGSGKGVATYSVSAVPYNATFFWYEK